MSNTKPKKEEFKKFDSGKTDYTMAPWESIEDMIAVMEFGKQKYGRDNWKECKEPSRFAAAAMRHLVEYMKGNHNDEESGEKHLAHAMCCVNMLNWLEYHNKDKNNG
ncbi:MAG: DUF5664 domain-containing protein [Gammaproteobacteria bacterium]|nr:DUF5664 domain-containing protein [Gammaproteobacteria bacterium]